ncbi:MAG: class I SAM-dependent methyltransferase [Candidatus Binatia bacterium]
MSTQVKQSDWVFQWSTLEDDCAMLFTEWIYPNTMEGFRGKTVLDAGCGGGQHMRFIAPLAAEVMGVDLNCAEVAAGRCRGYSNISTVDGDLATVDLGRQFDVVYSIGVLHHTDDPRASFMNIARHVKPGGRMIVWVYAYEGNFLTRAVVEPLKRLVYGRWPKRVLLALSYVITAALYLPAYTIYLLPLRFLPYFRYLSNFRRLSYTRNMLNVFDKLNAPQTVFLRREEVADWFARGFTDVHLSHYAGVSWRASGTRC